MPQPESTVLLIEAYFNGSASASESTELAKLLITDPEAAEIFAQASRIDTLLERHFQERKAQICWEPKADAVVPKGTGVRAFGVLTASLLVVMAVVILLWPGASKPTSVKGYSVLSGRVIVDGVETKHILPGSPFEVQGTEPAVIRLDEASNMRLAPATIAMFPDGSVNPVLRLIAGGGDFHVRRNQPLLVETEAGSILAQDTRFHMALEQTSSPGELTMNPHMMLLLTVGVLAGQVEVQQSHETSKMGAGQEKAFSPEKKPMFAGKVVAVSPDGQTLTIEGNPPKPNSPPSRRDVEITPETDVVYNGVPRDGDMPTVGYKAVVLLDKEAPKRAVRIEFGNPVPDVSGRVIDVAEDAKSIKVVIHQKNAPPIERTIAIADRTRTAYRDVEPGGENPNIGYHAEVWLDGETDTATEVRFQLIRKGLPQKNPPSDKANKKPNPKTTTSEPKTPASKSEGKPKDPFPKSKTSVEPKKEQAKPKPSSTKGSQNVPMQELPKRVSTRDPLPVSREIDRLIAERLQSAGIPASRLADDAEFLRRVTLDIAGRIPTPAETLVFLKSDVPDKRQRLVDDLLDSSAYGAHFATIWNELIIPTTTGKPKTGKDAFELWLAEQFNANRAWNEMVRDMLIVEGKIREKSESGFLMANAENGEPKPNLIADATSRLFWGVQLRCAECHDHPFAPWKQADFWGTAAFFSRVRKGYTDGKNPTGWTLTELPPDEAERQALGKWAFPHVEAGPHILIPEDAGARSGTRVKARFLGAGDVDWNDDGPFRERFANWAVGRENPYFAANAVNRMWAHFFGRGLVNPLDQFHTDNRPSHPELMEFLVKELIDSEYDLKHLIRCICNSQAYQRTSTPTADNEADATLFSHMAVRVIRPEVLYDSLSVAMFPPQAKSGEAKPVIIDRVNPIPNVSRDEFVRFFGSLADENLGSVVNQGIPQYLRLMNGTLREGDLGVIERFSRSASATEIINGLYLTTYSRYPTREELQRVREYFESSTNSQTAAAGLFWALINSSEFVLNH